MNGELVPGRIVMVKIPELSGWRPALVVGVHGSDIINCIVYLDGINDAAVGGSQDKLTYWSTSISHVAEETERETWCWPQEYRGLKLEV